MSHSRLMSTSRHCLSTVATAQSVSGIEGTSFGGPVATFTDSFTPNTAADFATTIQWGDGVTSTATIAVTATPGTFAINGSHVYNDEGTFTATAAVSEFNPRLSSTALPFRPAAST